MDPVRKDKKKLKKIRIYLKTHRYLTPLNFQQERRIFFKDNWDDEKKRWKNNSWRFGSKRF